MNVEKRMLHTLIRRVRGPRLVALALLLVTMLMVAVYSFGLSLSPSAEQRANFTFGSSNSLIDLRPAQLSEAIQQPDSTLVADISRAAASSVPGAVTVLHGNEPPLPRTKHRIPTYTEVYSEQENPLGWRLVSGRWPAAPGEVLLSQAALGLETDEHTVLLPTSAQPLQVVGTYVIPRAYKEVGLLGAPGTYRWLYSADQTVAARPEFGIEIRTDLTGDQAQAAFSQLLDQIQPLVALNADLHNTIMQTFTTRQAIIDWGATAAVDQDVWVFAVPLMVTITILLVGAFALSYGWLQVRVRQLQEIGVQGSLLTNIFFRYFIGYIFIAIIAGSLLGVGVGYVLRPVLQRLAENDLSPWIFPTKPILMSIITAAVVLLFLYSWAISKRQRVQARVLGRTVIQRLLRPSRVRRLLASSLFVLLLICETVLYVRQWDTTSMVMQTVLVMLLTLWIAIFAGNKVLSRTGKVLSAASFARRLRARHLLLRAVFIGIIAIITALPVGYSSINATWYNLKNTQTKPLAPADTVTVGALDFAPVPAGLPQKFEDATGLQNPTVVYSTWLPDQTIVATPTKAAGIPGHVLLLDDVAAANVFLAQPVTEQEMTALIQGGALVNTTAPGADNPAVAFQILHFSAPPSQASPNVQPEVIPVTVKAHRVEFKEGWDFSVGLIMLRSAAEHYGFPVGNSRFIYSGLNKQQLAQAYAVAKSLVNGTRFIVVSYQPEKVLNPVIFSLIAVGLAILLVIICLAVALSVQRHLAPVAAQLQVLGMPVSWFRLVSLNIIAVPIIWGGIIGMISGLMPAFLMALRYFGLELFGYDLRMIVTVVALLAFCAGCVPPVALKLAKRRLVNSS